jgi:hypothetical protein
VVLARPDAWWAGALRVTTEAGDAEPEWRRPAPAGGAVMTSCRAAALPPPSVGRPWNATTALASVNSTDAPRTSIPAVPRPAMYARVARTFSSTGRSHADLQSVSPNIPAPVRRVIVSESSPPFKAA